MSTPRPSERMPRGSGKPPSSRSRTLRPTENRQVLIWAPHHRLAQSPESNRRYAIDLEATPSRQCAIPHRNSSQYGCLAARHRVLGSRRRFRPGKGARRCKNEATCRHPARRGIGAARRNARFMWGRLCVPRWQPRRWPRHQRKPLAQRQRRLGYGHRSSRPCRSYNPCLADRHFQRERSADLRLQNHHVHTACR
jgi:hypothetical protein